MSERPTSAREQRIEEIRRAVVPVFAAKGFRGASMAALAEAVGVSRPALYQYFDNREDLFRSAFQLVLQEATDNALAALDSTGTLAERLDGYLQRISADGYQALAATEFGSELMEARHEFAADVVDDESDRARRGLRRFVAEAGAADAKARAAVVDLILLSPSGLKSDNPTPTVYRRRLTWLAEAAARLLE